MSTYDVIIIGSGIGGLTCGAFLAKHGKKVLILEHHHKPGGAVTSFSRQGFLFDIPSAVGSMSREFSSGKILAKLGIFDKVDFIRLDRLFRFHYPDLTVDCHADADRYHAELTSLFPAERRGLDRYFALMRSLMAELKRCYYAPQWWQVLLYPVRIPLLVRYQGASYQDLLDSLFRDKRLKAILSGGWEYLGMCPDRLSALYMLFMYQSYIGEGTFTPRGGFQALAEAFAEVFTAHGGELRLNALVERITLSGGRASGVQLDSGEHLAGWVVVSNADVKRTFFDLIGQDQMSRRLARRVENIEMSGSAVTAHLGVRMHIPESFNCGTVIYYPLWDAASASWEAFARNRVVTDLGKKVIGIEVRTLADPGLAPSGCHSVRITQMPVPYRYRDNWLQNDRHAYRDLKRELLDNLTAAAEQVLPGLSDNILVSDLSTPRTYERYLRSTEGNVYDAACTPDQVLLRRMPSRTAIPGLYLTGAKSFPGHGIVSAMQSGAFTADMLLEKRLLNGRYFFPE